MAFNSTQQQSIQSYYDQDSQTYQTRITTTTIYTPPPANNIASDSLKILHFKSHSCGDFDNNHPKSDFELENTDDEDDDDNNTHNTSTQLKRSNTSTSYQSPNERHKNHIKKMNDKQRASQLTLEYSPSLTPVKSPSNKPNKRTQSNNFLLGSSKRSMNNNQRANSTNNLQTMPNHSNRKLNKKSLSNDFAISKYKNQLTISNANDIAESKNNCNNDYDAEAIITRANTVPHTVAVPSIDNVSKSAGQIPTANNAAFELTQSRSSHTKETSQILGEDDDQQFIGQFADENSDDSQDENYFMKNARSNGGMIDEHSQSEDWQIIGDILYSMRYRYLKKVKKYKMKNMNDNSNGSSNSLNSNNNNKKQQRSKPNDNSNGKFPKFSNKDCIASGYNEFKQFYFKTYADPVFSVLRKKWLKQEKVQGISDAFIRKMFGLTKKQEKISEIDVRKQCRFYWKTMSTNSKSGSIFFCTINGEYIIKSMPRSECKFFREHFLCDYYKHMMSSEDSLLAKIFGVYKIKYNNLKIELQSKNSHKKNKTKDGNDGIYVMLMKSILYSEMTPTVKMHKIYDLKGSTHNRKASRYSLKLDELTYAQLKSIHSHNFEDEIDEVVEAKNNDGNDGQIIRKISHKYSPSFYVPKDDEKIETFKMFGNGQSIGDGNILIHKRSRVLKDIDFMMDATIITVGSNIANMYLKQLRSDLNFLIKMNVMDYSLLCGIHNRDDQVFFKHKMKHSMKPKRIKNGDLYTFEFGGMCKQIRDQNQIRTVIYFTGLIDFLQIFNTKKKMESFYKGIKNGKEKISAVDPKTYANRLYKFIENKIK